MLDLLYTALTINSTLGVCNFNMTTFLFPTNQSSMDVHQNAFLGK